MRTAAVGLLALFALGLVSAAAVGPATAGTVGAAVWNGCKNSMYNRYNNLRGAKVFVGGYNRSTGSTHCFWTWNDKRKATSANAKAMMAETVRDCKRAGYDYCEVYALNGSLTEAGLYARNLGVAEYHDEQQRREQQTNADVDMFMRSFLGAMGSMQNNSEPVYRPRYRPGYSNSPAKDKWNYNNNGTVCTPAQRARGWSEERCALN
ncbi:hypothetical protein [Mesorhizobium sp. WSM3879]|uniref:hypothetical protein n=1 Tax=Mesorhizobium sp. WSM3879 TaxID=2029406 RepID=UPI000BAF829D|nr:hypothetical protein [Mesorhizobium sp. WSM3879]